MAMTTKWSLDIRGHEFEDTEALRRAIFGSTCLVSLNSLSRNDAQDENISQSLQRDRSLAALLQHVTYAARDSFSLQTDRLFVLLFWQPGVQGLSANDRLGQDVT
jgi:hypothetical protein